VLSVVLTLCAIVALIWWLTGSSIHSDVSIDPGLQAHVAREALDRVRGGDLATSGSAEVGTILQEMLVGVGITAAEARQMVSGLGFVAPPVQDVEPEASGALTVFSMKDEYASAALERALLVGIQLARMDDDYAGVSDEAQRFDSLLEKADEVEVELFGDDRRARMHFYSRAALVLQDRIQSEPDAERRQVMGDVLREFDKALSLLQEEMHEAMAALPEDQEALAWGSSEDRRRYYFKMGVTNSLRRSGHLSSLGSLYRFRGVNYDVEEAYQLASEEEPLLTRAASLELSSLVALRPPDVRRLTSERPRGQLTQTEN